LFVKTIFLYILFRVNSIPTCQRTFSNPKKSLSLSSLFVVTKQPNVFFCFHSYVTWCIFRMIFILNFF
jgi:hypothetical protein